jgi:hypothetical protein
MKGVELTWAGGEHEFRLTIDLLRALQQKCDAGPQHILERLTTRRWMVDDVLEPIRLGLEGGGIGKEEARHLVRRFVEERPITEFVLTAQAIMMGALFGDEGDLPGEMGAGTEDPTLPRSPEENGASPASTAGQA